MSVSVGGLGIISLRNPFAEMVGMFLGKTDLRSVFCLVVFFIIVLVLAYLTNPSENSFRAYLTEQSFRQHLSRLDDNADDYNTTQQNSSSLNSTRRSTLATVHALSFDNSSPFHFANRASISLRTPKHVFHSFGILTIAAMLPIAKQSHREGRDGLMIADSWYIGAFGRWWRGGIIEAWYQDVIARSKDEESWSSGILSMKNLDMLNDYNGLPFSTKNLPQLLVRGSPPRLRNREKSSQRPSILPARSSTPPPLPKSASLPLHATRIPSVSSMDRASAQPLLQTHSQSCHPTDQVRPGSSLPSRPPSTLFDQSPRIAEVLRQISQSKTIVIELRTQLSDFQSCASQSHGLLQAEVDSFRDRKRKEDGTKLELKSRTKALDDSKRAAESVKKDTEKKLKAAQNAHGNATQRIDHLNTEISKLRRRLADDDALIHSSKDNVSETEQEIMYALEHKKLEIRAAEDIVTSLSQRARDLEERLSMEREKLAQLKEHNEAQRQHQPLRSSPIVTQHSSSSPWSTAPPVSHSSLDMPPSPESTGRQESLTGFEIINGLGRRPSISRDHHNLSNTLSLGSHLGFSNSPSAEYSIAATQAALRANGYSVFDDSILSASRQHVSQPRPSTTFSPFGDTDPAQSHGAPSVISPGQLSIPSTVNPSLDSLDNFSRSFQSEADVIMERDWRGFNTPAYSQRTRHRSNDNSGSGFATVTGSPVALHGPFHHEYELDPFEVRFTSATDYGQDQQTHHRMATESATDNQRVSWLHRTNSDPNPGHEINSSQSHLAMEKIGPRRWFSASSKEKPKKGLNPDAKVFNLARNSPTVTLTSSHAFNENHNHSLSNPVYDALNPNGLGSKVMPAPASTNNSLLRAFAPSPAEREALQRALGGSTNTSFERLPSLSDVGSIPSSPSNTHALPSSHASQHGGRESGKVLPSWLQSLPRIRKANFSPWEDEEPSPLAGVIGDNGRGGRR